MNYDNKANYDNRAGVYTSSLPEVREKQRERAKNTFREQLPLIVECLMEDEELLGQLAEALQSAQATTKTKK